AAAKGPDAAGREPPGSRPHTSGRVAILRRSSTDRRGDPCRVPARADCVRARLRGEEPVAPQDPYLLRDVTTLLIDTGMRPDECYRLRWENIRDGAVHVLCGKTSNARRVLPLTERAAALIEMRRKRASCEWVFPAPTRSGHM